MKQISRIFFLIYYIYIRKGGQSTLDAELAIVDAQK